MRRHIVLKSDKDAVDFWFKELRCQTVKNEFLGGVEFLLDRELQAYCDTRWQRKLSTYGGANECWKPCL
jgi:hypothetical protein